MFQKFKRDLYWFTKSIQGIFYRYNCPMFKNQLLAHSLGGHKGHTYCNTLPALQEGIKNGYRYFEADLSYTTDDRLVVFHGWSKKNCVHTGISYSPDFQFMTYDQVMKLQVFGEEIIDARRFYQEIKDTSYFFEIDFHSVTGETAKKRIYALLSDFKEDPSVLNRLLIQVYSEQMFYDIDSVYHFKYYQYLVGSHLDKLDEILRFCKRHGLTALAIRAADATPEVIKEIKHAGMHILCYTVSDDVEFAKHLFSMGVDTVCTDWILPEDLV